MAATSPNPPVHEPHWRTDDLYPGLDSPQYAAAIGDIAAQVTALGDLFVPGPTGTNVNDFRAILIRRPEGAP